MKFRLFFMITAILFCASAYAEPAAVINQNHLLLTLTGFFGVGILLAFTPCVLPMVPILSAILIGQEKISTLRALKLSSIYVLSMALTYAVAGMLAGYMGSTVQTAMQTPWIILSFSLVFVIMALSMFDLFSVAMPRALQNYVQGVSQRQKGGSGLSVAGMGVLSTLIASPCITPPLISVLTYIGQTGKSLQGGLILFVLALGMGMPLILFGVSQGALLPKAGAWMNTIKHAFGLMMLGLAVWIASRILPGAVTLFLWASLVIFGAVLFGALDFHSEKRLPLLRGLSVVALIYGVVMMVGAASGHDNVLQPLYPLTNANAKNKLVTADKLFSTVTTLSEVNQRLRFAKTEQKPVLMEFYASWCPSCKALDRNVFSDEQVQQRMRGFETIRVDITDQSMDAMKLIKHFNVYGTPTLIFYDKQGREIKTDLFAEGITTQSLLQVLENVERAS